MKTITSPVSRWPGTVIISDPLSYPQALAWRDIVDAVQKSSVNNMMDINAMLVPGILACVEEWKLEGGFTPDRFPATPPKSSAKIIAWLVTEISKLFIEADEVPLV